MTGFWLMLSAIFKWSFGFYNIFGNVFNWVLFIVAVALFVYWCWELVVPLGNNKDNAYKSPTKITRPYYDPEIYKKEG